MERIDGVLGNVHADEELARAREDHEENGTLERVVVDEIERKRSRLRVRTDAGTDLGIVVDRPALSGGDVLLLEDDRMIVLTLEPRDAIAVSLPEPAPDAMALAVELGHHVGNQHWDLAVSHGVVYVPLEADRHIVERVIRDVLPDADPQAVTVDAEVFVAGGSESVGAGHEDSHSHGDGDHEHTHSHSHGDHEHGGGDGHHGSEGDHREHDHEFTYGDDEDEP